MKISRWLTAIFIIAITITSLGFVKFQQIQAAIAMAESFPEPSAAVNAITTQQSQFNNRYNVIGQIQATQVVTLQNELGGIITQVNFSGGDHVNNKQLLIALDTATEVAQLSAAKANYTLANSNFARMTKLLKQSKVSQQEYDNANAQLQVEKANIKNLEATIAKKNIYAPFAGSIGLDNLQPGQYLAPGSTISTLVGDQSTMWVDFQVAQSSKKLAIGDTVTVQAISENGEQVVAATIIAKNSLIKASNRHLQYRAQFNNSNNQFFHNEIVSIEIVQASQDVVLVPAAAVSRNQHGDYLFVLQLNENNEYRAKRMPVTLGKRFKDQQLVIAGIEANKLIATEGAFKLREGLLVYPTIQQQEQLVAARGAQ